MRVSIKAIEFEDYRNIKNGECFLLGPITVLVGANETGKSNILRAIQLLKKDFKFDQDTKSGSKRSDQGETPILKYFLELNDEQIINYLKSLIKNYKKSDLLVITKDGDNSYKLNLAEPTFRIRSIEYKRQWENISSSPLRIKTIDNAETEIAPNSKFFGTKENRSQLPKLKKDKLISEVPFEEINKEFLQYVLKNVLPDIEFWEYKEEKHYIPNDVPFEQFIKSQNDFLSTKNLFIIAGKENKELEDYVTPLKNSADHDKQNFLDKVGEALTSVIKRTWSQSNIEIKLAYQTQKIRIDVYEGNRRTPPSSRSDGLKWFLSFLIDFGSRGELSEKVIILDQPGEKLHPGGQKELKARFREIASKNQIIFASQSPFLIDRNDWQQVKFLQKINGDSIIKIPSKYDVENDELLRYSLGFSLTDVGQANDWNIVVEGYDDQFVFKEIARRINNLELSSSKEPVIDFNRVAIFEKRGASTIKKRVDELLEVGLKAIGLFDGDETGRRELNKIRRSKISKTIFHSIDELANSENIQTIEDLLPLKLWGDACKEYFRDEKLNKNIFKNHRVVNLKDWYKKIHRSDLSKEKRDLIWNIVFEKWDEFFDKNDIRQIPEIKFIEQILQRANAILTKQEQKKY